MFFLFIRIIGLCNICKNMAKAFKFNLVDFGGEKIEHKEMTFCAVVLGWLVGRMENYYV